MMQLKLSGNLDGEYVEYQNEIPMESGNGN
jgi:hypothetical protein